MHIKFTLSRHAHPHPSSTLTRHRNENGFCRVSSPITHSPRHKGRIRGWAELCAGAVLLGFFLLSFTPVPASAENSITYYRDGALLHQDAVAVRGTVDIPLAAGILEHSLTVIPAAGTTILDVETHKNGQPHSVEKELETLTEQRRRLEDRLQALETRESIFTSAAKSQSGKAPRKTKTNPDPIQAIRQGTDFAIAQLEAVYTARRRTHQEIQKIDARLAATRKMPRMTENSVRITVTPPRGRVTLRYATSESGWQPMYTMYLMGDGTVKLQLSARLSDKVGGMQVRVSSGSLTESSSARTFPALTGNAVLAIYRLPITDERSIEGIFNSFSGTIANISKDDLPPGDSGLFRGGSYLGRFRFEGVSSGRRTVISFGKK